MTDEQFHEVYGSEVAGNHTVRGVPSDGIGELCEWVANDGTRFLYVTNDEFGTFGQLLTLGQFRAELKGEAWPTQDDEWE